MLRYIYNKTYSEVPLKFGSWNSYNIKSFLVKWYNESYDVTIDAFVI